jgi:glycosyltransferase involved in cell wall biosynthesis
MVAALREIFPSMEVVRSSRPFWFRRFQNMILKASKGRIDPYYFRTLNRYFARRLARRWRGERVLVIGVVNASLIAELASFLPVLNVTDSTFELMRNYYATFAKLSRRTAARAEDDELHSITRSVHNSFSSRWAADSAIRDYGAAPTDVSVISWGCNLDDLDAAEIRSPDERGPECRLLFIGGDWVRKGGDVVIAAAEILVERGIPVRADFVGAAPSDGLPDRSWVNHHGFLSKANPAELERLHAIMRDADFLFLPTRQDCTPMVFAESNAYGTPAITRDVGGVADVVHDGDNGIVLGEEASPADFASAIEGAWRDRNGYERLRRTSRQEYERRLNWRSWAKAIAEIIDDLEEKGRI